MVPRRRAPNVDPESRWAVWPEGQPRRTAALQEGTIDTAERSFGVSRTTKESSQNRGRALLQFTDGIYGHEGDVGRIETAK